MKPAHPPLRLMPGLLAALLILWSSALAALDEREALALALRTGFLPTDAELAALRPLDWEAAVQGRIDAATRRAAAPAVRHAEFDRDEAANPLRGRRGTERREALRERAEDIGELQAWWMGEMVGTPAPLLERMTLFWHSHFPVRFKPVGSPVLLYRQNQLFRHHALGDYRALLRGLLRDPAMLIFLDNTRNRKQAPNENLAREFLELFTLGEGHYRERDIKEAARALTGWGVDADTGEFRIEPRFHDDGEKEILGARGRFDGDDLVERVLAQPQAARFITEKLWREFVSPQPVPARVEALAAGFRRDWRLDRLLLALLTTPEARDPGLRGQLVKSPVELVVGVSRALALPVDDGRVLAAAAASQGQALFNPPNVRGWPQGVAWISSQTLLARLQYLRWVLGETPQLPAVEDLPGVLVNAARRQGRSLQARYREALAGRAERFPDQGGAARWVVIDPLVRLDLAEAPTVRFTQTLLDPSFQLK